MRRFVVSLFVLAFLGCAMSSVVLAESRDMGIYSLDIPENWTVERNNGVDTFKAPDGEGSPTRIVVSIRKVGKNTELAALAREVVGRTPIVPLEGGRSFLYEDEEGGRGWCMLADDGTFVGLRLDGAREDSAFFLGELKARKDHPGLEQAFRAAEADDHVVEWLRWRVLPLEEEAPPWLGEYCEGERCLHISNFRGGTDSYYIVFAFMENEKTIGDGICPVEKHEGACMNMAFTLSGNGETIAVTPLEPSENASPENVWNEQCFGTYTRR